MSIKRVQSITTRDRRVDTIVEEQIEKSKFRKSENAWDVLRRKKRGFSYDFPSVRQIHRTEFHQMFPDQFWEGRRCFIVGGGPSLRGFDFSLLEDELVIAINRAFEYLDPTIILWMDSKSFYRDLIDGNLGEDLKDKFYWSRAVKVALNISNVQYPPEIYNIRSIGSMVFSRSLEAGLGHGGNSGYAALNMAVLLGANPIYLLGYDMKGDGEGNQAWFHGGYRNVQGENIYKDFAKAFDYIAPIIQERGQKVINLNPNSALRCFEFGKIEDIRPPLKKKKYRTPRESIRKKWMLISFYTVGTSYEKEIKNLIKSLRSFKIPFYFFRVSPVGTWRGNLNYKSFCILRAMDMFPGYDIVFVDSDAIIRKYPILFDQLSNEKRYDIAAAFHSYSRKSGDADELLSGTLWIRNSDRSKKIIKRWHEIALNRPETRHQKCLHLALKELKRAKLFRMPFEYTCIFDYQRAKGMAPFIEHFQASRRFRYEVGYGVNLLEKN